MKNHPHKYKQNTLRGLAEAGDGHVRRVDAYRVNPRILELEEGFNVRIGQERDPELRSHIEGFKQTIRDYITKTDPNNRVSKGGLSEVMPPLLVRVTDDGRILVVEGHSRTIATRELIAEGFDIQELDVDVTKGDEADRNVVMVRSSQGKSLAPIEKAIAFVRMADRFNWSFPKIAQECGGGVTTQRVEQLVLLGRAPQEILDMVADRKVTADSAIEIVRKHRDNPQEAVRVLEALVAGTGSRRIGKGHVRASIPRRTQDALFDVFTRNASLSATIKGLSKDEGWENVEVQVSLPAGIIQQLLQLQEKTGDNVAAADGGTSN